jgi:hypothetical protein
LRRRRGRVSLAPELLLPPPLRPRRNLAPIPEAALTFAADRDREPRLTDDHGRSLVGDAEDGGDLDELNGLASYPPLGRIPAHHFRRPAELELPLDALDVHRHSPTAEMEHVRDLPEDLAR